MKTVRRVLLVGHCGADQFMLTTAVQQAVGDAVAVAAVNDTGGLDACGGEDLLLINRQLDGRFGCESGLDLITRLAARSTVPLMMLISNYADAQQQAVAAGARQGFGKSQLGAAETLDLLRGVIGR